MDRIDNLFKYDYLFIPFFFNKKIWSRISFLIKVNMKQETKFKAIILYNIF